MWWRRQALVVVVAALLGGCPAVGPHATRSGDWLLLHPPDVVEPLAPRGRRLLPAAPLVEWHQAGAFPTETACEEARHVRATTVIDRTRAAEGENARFDLDVRRAVNARCVHADALAP
jgi:hypothetical protein